MSITPPVDVMAIAAKRMDDAQQLYSVYQLLNQGTVSLSQYQAVAHAAADAMRDYRAIHDLLNAINEASA